MTFLFNRLFLLNIYRSDPTIPHYNSSFAEYKFAKFKKRIVFKQLNFPKSLSLDFAKSLTDVDKYLQDIEVKQMMERLRARIAALEHEVSAEDQKEIEGNYYQYYC